MISSDVWTEQVNWMRSMGVRIATWNEKGDLVHIELGTKPEPEPKPLPPDVVLRRMQEEADRLLFAASDP